MYSLRLYQDEVEKYPVLSVRDTAHHHLCVKRQRCD